MVQHSDLLLKAIVSIDLFGYSRLMELDEIGTHRILMRCRRQILEPTITQHNGHIVKSTGDGALVVFSSVPEAVYGMIEFQRRIAIWGESQQEDKCLVFRVGVHVAATIIEDGDLYGNGVNLAVRLQEAAEPGSIYLSRAVFDSLENTTALRFEYLGKQRLKNISKRIHFYRWREGRPRPSRRLRRQLATAAAIGLAVVVYPFDGSHTARHAMQTESSPANRSREAPHHQTQTAVLPFAQSHTDAELGYLMDAVFKDAMAGSYVWAEHFDSTSTDLLLLEDQIARRGASSVATTLEASKRSLQNRSEIAEDVYIQAWAHYGRHTPRDLRQATKDLEYALDLDPDYDDAHALLAAIYWASWQNRWQMHTGLTVAETLKRAQHHLNEIGQPTAVAHVVTSEILTASGRHDDAIAEAERAIVLEPGMAVGHYAKGLALIFDGQPAEAESLIRTAVRLNPHSPRYLFGLALAQFNLNRFDDAFSALTRATERNVDDDWPFLLLAATAGYLGRKEDARRALRRFDRLSIEHRGWFANQIPYVHAWPFRRNLDQQRLYRGMTLAGIPEPVRLAARQ